MFQPPHRSSCRRRVAFAAPLAYVISCLVTPDLCDASVLQQSRSLSSWVSISGCPSATQNASAGNLDPFNESVGVSPKCGHGDGSASAAQTSSLALTRFISQGDAEVGASAQNTVVHALGRSNFDISVQLTSPRSYRLVGSIEATRNGAQVVESRVRLTGNAVVWFHAVVQPPQNQSDSITFNESGVLEPGSYQFFVRSDAFIDAFFQPGVIATASASHDVKLTLGPVVPGDVTGDGVVNVDDLLAVINAWGACVEPLAECAADIQPHGGDGVVNVDDLLAVITGWSAAN